MLYSENVAALEARAEAERVSLETELCTIYLGGKAETVVMARAQAANGAFIRKRFVPVESLAELSKAHETAVTAVLEATFGVTAELTEQEPVKAPANEVVPVKEATPEPIVPEPEAEAVAIEEGKEPEKEEEPEQLTLNAGFLAPSDEQEPVAVPTPVDVPAPAVASSEPELPMSDEADEAVDEIAKRLAANSAALSELEESGPVIPVVTVAEPEPEAEPEETKEEAEEYDPEEDFVVDISCFKEETDKRISTLLKSPKATVKRNLRMLAQMKPDSLRLESAKYYATRTQAYLKAHGIKL